MPHNAGSDIPHHPPHAQLRAAIGFNKKKNTAGEEPFIIILYSRYETTRKRENAAPTHTGKHENPPKKSAVAVSLFYPSERAAATALPPSSPYSKKIHATTWKPPPPSPPRPPLYKQTTTSILPLAVSLPIRLLSGYLSLCISASCSVQHVAVRIAHKK